LLNWLSIDLNLAGEVLKDKVQSKFIEIHLADSLELSFELVHELQLDVGLRRAMVSVCRYQMQNRHDQERVFWKRRLRGKQALDIRLVEYVGLSEEIDEPYQLLELLSAGLFH